MWFRLPDIISIFLILVFFLGIGNIYSICNPSIVYSFLRTITHADISHLVFNLGSYHNISDYLIQLEGDNKYALILSSIWLLDVISDYLLTNYQIKWCSIGFSGVVFGLLTYLFLVSNNDLNVIVYNLVLLLAPGFFSTNISNTGHIVGIINGAIIYHLFKFIGV